MKVYLALHKLVVSVVPKLEFSVDVVDAGVGYGAHQFGYNGWGMAALSLHNRWVRLTLLQGSRLEDPAEIMEGSSTMRHVKISTMSEVETKREAVEAILFAASTVNQGYKPARLTFQRLI